ncbi:enolase, partial [Tanacetum coccineum]
DNPIFNVVLHQVSYLFVFAGISTYVDNPIFADKSYEHENGSAFADMSTYADDLIFAEIALFAKGVQYVMSLFAHLGLIFFILPIPMFGITSLMAELDYGCATELSIWISMMHIFLSCSAGGGWEHSAEKILTQYGLVNLPAIEGSVSFPSQRTTPQDVKFRQLTWGKERTIEQVMKEFDYDGDTKVIVDEFTNRNMDKTQQMLVMKENKEGIELLKTTIAQAGYEGKNNGSQKISGVQLKDLYKSFVSEYPIVSIEDPFDQDDWEHYGKMTAECGDKVQIVGDDLLVTNPMRVKKAIEEKSCNALLLKVNQIGSVTERIEVVKISNMLLLRTEEELGAEAVYARANFRKHVEPY